MALSKLAEWITPGKKLVYNFSDGSLDDRNLLGYKGALLCEMKRIKIPVPDGFIVSTDACTDFLYGVEDGKPSRMKHSTQLPLQLCSEITKHIHELEKDSGKVFGIGSSCTAIDTPLLISLRVSTKIPLKGIMDTVLNVGLNDSIVHALAATSKCSKFAYDTYRRFLQLYGTNVNGIDPSKFTEVLERVFEDRNLSDESQLTTFDLQKIVQDFKILAEAPEDPYQQIFRIVEAIYCSWESSSATQYRSLRGVSDTSGAAVIIQSMVYGNKDDGYSGSGVLCTRNPCTGQKEITGEFLAYSEGDDVLHGSSLWDCTPCEDYDACITTHHKLALATKRGRIVTSLEDGMQFDPKLLGAYNSLISYAHKLETHFRDMQDIEFTIQNGKVYVLECSSAKRSAKAAVKVCVDMAVENLLTEREAILRIEPEKIGFFERNCILKPSEVCKCASRSNGGTLAKGLSVSVGAVSGKLAFTKETAVTLSAEGHKVVYCTDRPWQLDGIKESDGLLLLNGTMHSLGSRAARNLGKCGIALVSENSSFQHSIDRNAGELHLSDDCVLSVGDDLTLDGSTGNIYAGMVPMTCGTIDTDYQTVMEWANRNKHIKVFAQTGSYNEAAIAAEHGAEGIGLCRTDYMINSGDCRVWTRAAILTNDRSHRIEHLNKVLPFHEEAALEVLELMPAKQVSFRLLDSPLHEFLPKAVGNIPIICKCGKNCPADCDCCKPTSELDIKSLVNFSEYQDLAEVLGWSPEDVHSKIRDMEEITPFLGFRGSRLCIVYPEIATMQTKAIIGAAITAAQAGHTLGRLEIVIPLVISDHEVQQIVPNLTAAAESVMSERDFRVEYSIGVSIEVPRGCMRADSLALDTSIDSITFDSNSLTQLMYGFSKLDAHHFLDHYVSRHILASNPFKCIDKHGVGSMMELGINKARRAIYDAQPTSFIPSLTSSSNATIGSHQKIGICGDHGADPYSVSYFSKLKVNNISVPPTKISVAKISAAKAHIQESAALYRDVQIADHMRGQILLTSARPLKAPLQTINNG